MSPELRLIVFAGPQLDGKTTLAREVARRLRAVYLQKKTLKEAILALGRELRLDQVNALATPLSYQLLTDVARDNLSLGLSVVLDCPAGYRQFRENVESLVRSFKAEVKLIECISTDESLLRERVDERKSESPEGRPGDSQSSQESRERFERISGPRLVVDTAETVSVNARKVMVYLGLPAETDLSDTIQPGG